METLEKKFFVTKINDGFCYVERTFTWIVFAVMLALMLIQVFCRYVLMAPLAWSEELMRYIYVAVCYTGSIVAVREGSHIQIDIILSLIHAMFKKSPRRERIANDALDIFGNIVICAFFIIAGYWMILYNIDIADKGQITTALQWPTWWFCLPVTISCILMAFHGLLNFIEKIYDIVKGSKMIPEGGEVDG